MDTIIKHDPPPVEPPPATYDLLGLTSDEIALLRALVGHALTKTHRVETWGLYSGLSGFVETDPVARATYKRINKKIELAPRHERSGP